MKQIYFILLLSFCLFPFLLQGQTGCPNCQIDFSCNVPGGGLCPDSLPGGTVGQYYQEDVTFYLPTSVYVSQLNQNLPLMELQINGMSGLPFGLNWECNSTANGCKYFPQQNQYGCVRFCGIPLLPGTYPITVYTTGTVDAGVLGYQSGPQIFYATLVIAPDTASNNGFSFAPPLGCVPLKVTFINNFPSNGYQPTQFTTGFTYSWDFGNSQQSNAENPPPVTYYTPGNYVLHYTATVDTIGFYLTQIKITSVNCTDPCCFNSIPPDIYVRLYDGNNALIFASSTFTDTDPPITITLPNNGIFVSNPPYRIEIFDGDNDADDECYNDSENPIPNIYLPLPDSNEFGTVLEYWTGPTPLTFNCTYVKISNTVSVYDTVIVFGNPPDTTITLFANDTICTGDSVKLSVYPGYGYQWFFNDTLLIAGADSNFYYATQAGTYKVRIFNLQTGCDFTTTDTAIYVVQNIPDDFPILWDGLTGTLSSTITGNGYSYQWLQFNGSFYAPSLNDTNSNFVLQGNGSYRLLVTTQYGCFDTSAVFKLQNFSINNVNGTTKLLVFPNPAKQNINLVIEGEMIGKATVTLVNLTGQKILTKDWQLKNGKNTLSIPVSGIASGFYVLKVNSNVGTFSRSVSILD